jgi:hypothetical protein
VLFFSLVNLRHLLQFFFRKSRSVKANRRFFLKFSEKSVFDTFAVRDFYFFGKSGDIKANRSILKTENPETLLLLIFRGDNGVSSPSIENPDDLPLRSGILKLFLKKKYTVMIRIFNFILKIIDELVFLSLYINIKLLKMP